MMKTCNLCNDSVERIINNDHPTCVGNMKLPRHQVIFTDECGDHLLKIAAEKGSIHSVQKLIQLKFNINSISGSAAVSPLQIACHRGHYDVVNYLLKSGAIVDQKNNLGYTALHYACQRGSVDCATLLIKKFANVNAMTAYGCTPLYLACEANQLACAKLLLENYANPNAENIFYFTPITVAFHAGHKECVALLKSHGAKHAIEDEQHDPQILY